MSWRLVILVFVLGATTLAGEIALARLVAPYWGSGIIVWSSIIALVLLALALGYWIGGKRADRHPNEKSLVLWLLPGVILLIAMPWLGKALLGESPLLFIIFITLGSSAFFFLGGASPWSLRLMQKDTEHSGELAGKLFAASTVGSFLGTMISALVLLPNLGTGRTFFLLGAISLLALSLLDQRVILLLTLPIALWIFWQPGESRAGTLWEGESAEQHLRVREVRGVRTLELDDGRDVQSIYRPGEAFSGYLWDAPLYLWRARSAAQPGRLLVLGNGAGTTLSAWSRVYKEGGVGIELDPKITELGERFFGLKLNERVSVLHGDARWRMRGLNESFSTIFLDTYDANYIPFHLLTEEFFIETKERLLREGILIINVQPQKDILGVIGRTTKSAFKNALIWRYSSGNSLVLLSNSPLSSENIINGLSLIPDKLQEEAIRASSELEPLSREGDLWTDDLAPAEKYSG